MSSFLDRLLLAKRDLVARYSRNDIQLLADHLGISKALPYDERVWLTVDRIHSAIDKRGAMDADGTCAICGNEDDPV